MKLLENSVSIACTNTGAFPLTQTLRSLVIVLLSVEGGILRVSGVIVAPILDSGGCSWLGNEKTTQSVNDLT